MPRRLAESKVIRELKRRGWHWDGQWFRWMPYGNIKVVAEFCPKGMARLKLLDGRLKEHPNVHVVSYWGPFSSVAEMKRELDRAEGIYNELCGALFPERERQ